VVHKFIKLFQAKLSLLENYNFIIGEPLRHCVPPPLPLSQGEEFGKARDIVHIIPSARGGVLGKLRLLLLEQRQAEPCPTGKREIWES